MWAIGWLACASDEGPGNGPALLFDDTVAALVAATGRHGERVLGATAMSPVRDEEQDYAAWCTGQWDTLGSCMDAFMACDDEAAHGGMHDGMHGDGMDGWHDQLDDLADAMDAHHDAMDGCSTLECCWAEEAAWQDHAGAMFDAMGDAEPAWDEDCGW